ncbi:hypothetical protein RRG08_045696 [Elysia crispata]|uniref:Uncharacterized protein n=1 Tax=Elysia crispata TaxID=231223 RepID=A0AAE0Z271_9GAST|nr:hypothetical protein RRG08_045696 [Elysia crispata]
MKALLFTITGAQDVKKLNGEDLDLRQGLTEREQDGRQTASPLHPNAARCLPERCRLRATRLRSLTKAADCYRVDLGDSSARVSKSSISCQTKPSQWRLADVENLERIG